MSDKYYVVKEKAVPEVLLKVLEAKKMMERKKLTVQQATEEVGISRSSFYKYQDDIFPFHDNAKGKTITFILQIDDEPGVLSDVLKCIAASHGNILTIHQSIPIHGVATLTISVDIAEDTGDVSTMIGEIQDQQGVHDFKILGGERK
ncbi:MAG: ACT domain-containing protein [Lachnospiraceae bacterium]|nr:ACT domain-containing protein [Lachnospiraceae bacterium]